MDSDINSQLNNNNPIIVIEKSIPNESRAINLSLYLANQSAYKNKIIFTTEEANNYDKNTFEILTDIKDLRHLENCLLIKSSAVYCTFMC